MLELFNMLASAAMKLIFAGVGIAFVTVVTPWIRETAVPWLREKRLYNLCYKFVLAAEKSAESGFISREMKKKFVVDCLTSKGITVTAEIDAYIECAVEELDLAIESGLLYIDGLFADAQYEDIEDGEDYERQMPAPILADDA